MSEVTHRPTDKKQNDIQNCQIDEQPNQGANNPQQWLLPGLSAKLLILTILFVMISEVLIFVPSIANFRKRWLADRVESAQIIAVVLDARQSGMEIPDALRNNLLNAIGADAVAVKANGMRHLLAMADMPPTVDLHIDLRTLGPTKAIVDAFDTLFARDGRILRVIGEPPNGGDFIEIIMSETALREAMLLYSRNISVLSLIISLITASLVYLALLGLFVRPMRWLVNAMVRFSNHPDDPKSIVQLSKRHDEIGDAQNHLARMQKQLAETLSSQKRLANLGLAVSKINHDLRNMLAAAQLLSDRLTLSPDPTVQRLAPKLLATLDRAIHFTETTLAYGRARELPPERRLICLERIIDDVAEVVGLLNHSDIRFENKVATDIEVDADPDQLFRVLLNICRNSKEALERYSDPAIVKRIVIKASRQKNGVIMTISDTGPGIPPMAKEHLFEAFKSSVTPGGTGLGLAIAAELITAHSGTITLRDSGPGACFEISIPDRDTAANEADMQVLSE